MEKPVLKIRRAKASDLTDVADCARKAYARYVDRIGQEPAPMNADFEGQIEQGYVFVARHKFDFVGYVVMFDQANVLHLENIAVLPSCAGKGLGGALIAFVEQTARDRGLDAVELYTNEAMTENLAMYSRLGYTKIERKMQDGFNRVFFRKYV